MSDLDETVRTLRERIATREKCERRLTEATQQLDRRKRKLSEARATLKKEHADVARLEGLSLTALFYTVLSSKTEQLDKERQEVLRAELVRNECRTAVQELEDEMQRLRDDLGVLKGADEELTKALAAKESALQQAGGPAAIRLFEIADERAALGAEAKEIEEAQRAGENAFDSLTLVSDSLGTAENWGTWDLLGGGVISTAIKHSHIDKGRTYAHEAQSDLRAFSRELADVERQSSIELKLGSFESFADYFFDGLIIDWVVQSKIGRSRKAALEVREHVRSELHALRKRANDLEQRAGELESERQAVLGRSLS